MAITYHLIGISETFRTDTHNLKLPGYHDFISRTRDNSSRGGVGLYTSENIQYIIREDILGCAVSMRRFIHSYIFILLYNWFIICQGMYPESHGIVDNNMYDMDLGEAFWLGSPTSMNPEWWIGEPVRCYDC